MAGAVSKNARTTVSTHKFLCNDCGGEVVIMDLDKYAEITDDIEMKLDETDYAAELSDVRFTHEEVFARLKSR